MRREKEGENTVAKVWRENSSTFNPLLCIAKNEEILYRDGNVLVREA